MAPDLEPDPATAPLPRPAPRAARLLAGATAAIIAVLLAGCGEVALADRAAAPPPPSVRVATAVSRAVTDWDAFTGRFEAPEQVLLRPRVSGYIEEVTFEEGTLVERGQVLFRIDARPYQAALDRARAELARAEAQHALAGRELARVEELLRSRVISREEYDRRASEHRQLQANLNAAEAAVKSSALDVEFTRVAAPISGRVSRAEVTEGNFVRAGETRLTTLVSVNPIYVYFDGDEQTYLKYATPDRADAEPRAVRVGLAGERGYPHTGHLNFIDNTLDAGTGTIRVRAVLDNSDGRFAPGLFARVQVWGGARSQVTLIDDRAIGTDQDRRFVYVVDEDNTLHYRGVEVGEAAQHVGGAAQDVTKPTELRVVEAGLQPGERVVVGSLAMLRPGMAVDPAETPPSSPSGNETLALN